MSYSFNLKDYVTQSNISIKGNKWLYGNTFSILPDHLLVCIATTSIYKAIWSAIDTIVYKLWCFIVIEDPKR